MEAFFVVGFAPGLDVAGDQVCWAFNEGQPAVVLDLGDAFFKESLADACADEGLAGCLQWDIFGDAALFDFFPFLMADRSGVGK